MIRFLRRAYHLRRLARIVERNRQSFEIQDYRKRRAAALSHTRRLVT